MNLGASETTKNANRHAEQNVKMSRKERKVERGGKGLNKVEQWVCIIYT